MSEDVKKPKRQKKRMSSFEIMRTLFQRTCDRRLPYLLRNVKETPGTYLLCSDEESEFKYGSSKMSIAIIEITDPAFQEEMDGVLQKIKGLEVDADPDIPVVINLRDQISDLGKSKGESFSQDLSTNTAGDIWVYRKDKDGNILKDKEGRDSINYYLRPVDALFHFLDVPGWLKTYIPVLRGEDNGYLVQDFVAPADGNTHIVTIDPHDGHPLFKHYPHGFRIMLTRGVDMIGTRQFDDFPFPLVKEELVVVPQDQHICRVIHRVEGEGWRMIIHRPSNVIFPRFTKKEVEHHG